jgi:hypothetical protein
VTRFVLALLLVLVTAAHCVAHQSLSKTAASVSWWSAASHATRPALRCILPASNDGAIADVPLGTSAIAKIPRQAT